MREANYGVIDFLEYTGLRSAKFYPPGRWGGKDAGVYIRIYIQERFKFHWSTHEPWWSGTGTS